MIEQNVREIIEKLKEVNPATKLIAATKTRTQEEIRVCMDTGLVLAAGENRVQELTQKYMPEYRWDFIGQLQTNKVKYIIDKAELIHSVDRTALADVIQKECVKHNKKQKVLVEINTGKELSKGGIDEEDMDAFLDELTRYDRIVVSGLMAVAPVFYTPEETEKAFDSLYELFAKRQNAVFNTLSMGMSNDYLIAAKCGANVVRIGRAIFGERSYT